MVCANKENAKTDSRLGEVGGGVLRVKCYKIVHSGGLGTQISNKLLKLHEGCYIFKNDDGWAQ